MAAKATEKAGALEWETPQPLFPVAPMGLMHPYDVSPDGRFFVLLQTSEPSPAATQIHVVQNWQAGLKKSGW